MQRQTTMAKVEGIKRNWYLVDAEGAILGRLAGHPAWPPRL